MKTDSEYKTGADCISFILYSSDAQLFTLHNLVQMSNGKDDMKLSYISISCSAIILTGLALFSGIEAVNFSGDTTAKKIDNNAQQTTPAALLTESSFRIRDITADKSVSITPIEASGVVYIDSMHSFLVISDDTERKQPDLFLMDTTGRITSKRTITGLDKINDMESICSAGSGVFYALSSQSYNKKDKQPLSRTLFMRFRQNGAGFEQTGNVPLFPMLLEAASAKPTEKCAEFVAKSNLDKSIDIEGMTVYKDTLLLGFKNPKTANHATILAIADFNTVFNSGKISSSQISVWRTLPLFDTVSSTFCGISDLAVHGDMLYGVSTGVSLKNGVEKDIGLLWKYFPSTDSLVIMQNFRDIKPEGITVFGEEPQYCIVFDNGTKIPSQFIIEKDSLR